MKKILLLTFFLFTIIIGPGVAEAAIDVSFETTPLFGVSNFLPGDTITKTVIVTNTGPDNEDVYTELINVVDGGLAPMMTVIITSGGTLFSGSFNDFENANEQFLTTLPASASVTYNYAMSFQSVAGNEYQNKSLGFDICIGFSGGQFECDIDDIPTDNPGGGGNGGNGGGGGNGNSSPLERDGQVLGEVAPTPQVLGDQVSIIPVGAPNTGFGGAIKTAHMFIILIYITLFSLILRRFGAGKARG